MVKTNAKLFLHTGYLPTYTHQRLYGISYIDADETETYLYIGQSKRPVCRLATHFNTHTDGCRQYHDRSGASRAFSNMFQHLSDETKHGLHITLFELHDLCTLIDVDNPRTKRRILKSKIAVSDFYHNNVNSKTVDFAEEILSLTFKPVFCEAWYSRLFKNSPLPKQLRGY